MKIVTDSSGRNYVEIDSVNGVTLVPNTNTTGIYTDPFVPDPYTLAKLFDMRGAMWDERSYGFSAYRPPEVPSQPPEPPNRFQHLDWEEDVA